MIVELGHFALVLALALALVQSSVPFWGALQRDPRLIAVAPPAAITQFLLVGLAFAALVNAHVASDFSLVNVVENSHSAKPLLYKLTGVWGNHEGSMLLWVLILALFGALVAAFGRNLPDRLKALVLAVQAWIAAAFLLFILLTSNPFLRIDSPPAEGNDLNPVLQDIGLAIHPPLLYLGYVGCSISFAFAVAALIDGRIDAAWARWVRPWTLAAWLFLTLGIAMGSYWAYYTLGWGGFWFWDPVENASLMPWLVTTALLHSADRHGEARRPEDLDGAPRHPRLLAEPDRHLPRPLRRAHLGPRLRLRPDARHLHPRHPLPLHRRRADALRLPRRDAGAGRHLRADQPRGRARPQQPVPHRGRGDGRRRHALSARPGGADRNAHLGRRAVLQSDLRAAGRAAALSSSPTARSSPGSAATSAARRNG